MRPLYIFDLDGTLALIEHRRHFVENGNKQWPEFFKACVDDKPNWPVINLLKSLRKSGAEIWVWSGRSNEVELETQEWLHKHGIFKTIPLTSWEPFKTPWTLLMRKAGDHQPDHTLKFGWLANLEPPERNRLCAVFDDRDRIVKMWRDNGIVCFQVAPGNF